MNRKIYLARHGQTIYGDEIRFIGRTDVDLSEKGLEQAGKIADYMKDVKLSAIYTSPLLRCRKTARAVAAFHDLEPVVVEDLSEIDLGEWEDMYEKDIKEKYPEEYDTRRPLTEDFGPPGGETWGEVKTRVIAAMEKIIEQAPPGPIFIAAHRGVNGVYICHAMNLPLSHLFDIDNDYGCLNIFNFADGAMNIELLNWTGQDPDFPTEFPNEDMD